MAFKLAKISKIKKLSPVWIFPIVTLLIGIWVLYTHFSEKGKSFTLISSDANGIVAGKTMIKSRNVDVGMVDKVTLSHDLKQVIIKGSIDRHMTNLLKEDSIFWVVKPQINIEGISGLGTLFSGVYIEVMAGTKDEAEADTVFHMLDAPPVAALNTEGMRIQVVSQRTSVVSQGAPVLFRGFRVGNVEKAEFDVKDKMMKYQVFVAKPYDSLLTKNIRFWREGGINLDLSSKGANLDVPSLDILVAGGISFDVPKGASFGPMLKQDGTASMIYQLYPDKDSIQDSQYTQFEEYLLLFSESIAGLTAGASVEYRGIRLGTVAEVPYFGPGIDSMKVNGDEFTVPVLIKIEPQRVPSLDEKYSISQLIMDEQKKGLRASLKSSNLFTGSMYIDLDFYPDYTQINTKEPTMIAGYKTIATAPSGLSQLQHKVFRALDIINKLPLQQTVTELNKTITSLNKIVGSKDMQSVPKDFKDSLNSLKRTLKSLQPGAPMNQSLQTDLDKFERMLDQLSPLLKTLNEKSNALIFAAPAKSDPKPKAKGSNK